MLHISWCRGPALKGRSGQEANEGARELGVREKLLPLGQLELSKQARQHLGCVKALEDREIFLKVWTLDFLHLNGPILDHRM